MSILDALTVRESINEEDEIEDAPDEEQCTRASRISAHGRAKSDFCCIAKEYYSEYGNLVDSLQIIPRLIVNKKGFKKNATYGLSIAIRNNGLYPRNIRFFTDSPNDTQLSVLEHELNRYLETDKVINIKIWIRSTTAHDINRPRHIFIETFHPNIVFEVPIIVLQGLEEPTYSKTIILPACVPKDKSYYEMIIYNPKKEPVPFKLKNTFHGLTISDLHKDEIPRLDYVKLLLTFHPKKLQIYKGFFNLKFSMEPARLIMFEFTPKSMGAYLSHGHIVFGQTKFDQEETRKIIICNESPHILRMCTYFSIQQRDTVHSSLSINSKMSRLFSDAVSMHSVLMYDFEEEGPPTITYNEEAEYHFNYDAPDVLEAYSTNEIILKFRPNCIETTPFSDAMEPPYFQRTKIHFCLTDSDDCVETQFVTIEGEVGGIEVEIFPKVIDFRKIYLGEEHCAFIKILNVDGVNAKVNFKDALEEDVGGVRISPEAGYDLAPCERGVFTLSFFTIVPTRFTLTLRFKVVNGSHYKVLIKGTGQHVQLRTFPQLVEFGSIPIAVPQKRFMLLMNPLAVPITLQVTTTDDGEEQPLVLNIRDSTEMLPITVRDPIKHLQKTNDELREEVDLTQDFEFQLNEQEELSVKSYSQNESIYSAEFEEEVMEPVPVLASHLLKNLKKQKIFDKSETDKRVIQETLREMLNTKYFNIFSKHNNFIFMDWNALPSDPREIYCDNEVIYLRPNTGRSITILIVPNRVGYFHRSLTVRICPAVPLPSESSEDQQHNTLIESKYLCSKLWYEFNCCIPDIEWINFVDLTERVIYAGEEYYFDMVFSNPSTVSGFVHYEVVPNEMSFRDGTWKFFIAGGAQAVAKCSISFHMKGQNKLTGLVKVVGGPHPYPFHIFAQVLPPEIRIRPRFVHRLLHVYEENKIHFYIDNCSPTNTMLTLRLEDCEFQYLTTRGGVLAATGQSMYTTLVSMFLDPDLYRNTLYVDLQFDHVMEIPITFLVEGVPLYFEPDIKKGYDAGLLFTDSKEDFNANIFMHRFKVKVINRGQRYYRVSISRLKTYNPTLSVSACTSLPLMARFEIQPKLLELSPNSFDYMEVLISAYEEGVYQAEFMLNITDIKYPQRKHILKVTIKATFVDCQLQWSPRQLNFHFQPKTPLKDRTHIAIAELINPFDIPVENVILTALGPFRIKALFEHLFERQISTRFDSHEHKEIFVLFHRPALKQLCCKLIEGRVTACAEGMPQKYLQVRVHVLVPELAIMLPELVLFDRGRAYETTINIVNLGCAAASYKWHRLWVTDRFVGDDDPADVVAEILDEILRMLEYNFKCDEEPNMTLRYQLCRCQFHHETEVGNLVLEIIEDIINELDLSQRRFIINLNEMDISLDDSAQHSTTSFIQHTLDELLNRLNVESSQELSEASSEYCFLDRFIYFYEKTGEVAIKNSQDCVLHLPHINRGHELKTVFQLGVIGGIASSLAVTLVNLNEKIRFHNDNVYLNIKPWYELFNTTIRISNVTQYPLQLIFVDMRPDQKEWRFVDGYAKIMQSYDLALEPLGIDKIQLSGILGFSENFQRSFAVLINKSALSYFRLRGQGVLPILCMTSQLPRVTQSMVEILDEYTCMRIIYNYEIFKSITETDEEPPGGDEEEDFMEDYPSEDFSVMSISGEEEMSDARQRAHDYQFYRMLRTYVLVNNNEELPNAVVLNQMLLTERYLRRLRYNSEVFDIHQQVYQTYLKEGKNMGYKQPSTVKHITVQPLPCEQHGYVLDLGPLTRNTLRKFELNLHFFGPGKLIAAARTAVRIPGLFVDFQVDNHIDKKFTFWAEQCKAPEFFKDSYRNMLEREVDADKDPKLKHAHSFDLNEIVIHQRDVNAVDRRIIDEYYISFNPSVYPDHKHHFTLAKVYTAHSSNFSGVDVRLVGYFRPSSKYYKHQQRIEDYIYIDLHMGPTLPILLKGICAA
ncbi:CG15824 [Drosophila busckii]|uniref:CG15824 n=1 Tax=Drosophila busckii TaxID=30019 RepID=A0A0M4EAR8_DROBS|nr:CG15824 [Drosophila busckii]